MVVGGRELIDTLWNVNEKLMKKITRNVRINRYIMECKFVKSHILQHLIHELIDTLWNVNVAPCIMTYSFSGINRYIMECK